MQNANCPEASFNLQFAIVSGYGIAHLLAQRRGVGVLINRKVYGFLLALGSNPHAAAGGVRIGAEKKIFVGVCSLALESGSPTARGGWGCGSTWQVTERLRATPALAF